MALGLTLAFVASVAGCTHAANPPPPSPSANCAGLRATDPADPSSNQIIDGRDWDISYGVIVNPCASPVTIAFAAAASVKGFELVDMFTAAPPPAELMDVSPVRGGPTGPGVKNLTLQPGAKTRVVARFTLTNDGHRALAPLVQLHYYVGKQERILDVTSPASICSCPLPAG